MLRFRLLSLIGAVLFLALSLLAQPIPRPEHPEPQFVRSQWLNLNGEWQFAFDDGNRGMSENWWQAEAKPFDRKILVPFAPESRRSGIGDTAFHPWVWYRRAFVTPDGWNGKRIRLHFGAVDYRAKVWVNGVLAGEHEGGQTPFVFDVTPLLHPTGSNEITVRAEDLPQDQYQPRGKQYWQPKSRGIFYTRTTGIWQTVWLEAVGERYLERVQVLADSRSGEARFTYWLNAPAPDAEFHVELRFSGETQAKASASVDYVRGQLAVRVPDVRSWNLQTPHLYEVVYELRRGSEVLDRVESYLGFRSVAVQEAQFLLNDRPTYLRLVLDQGYWPDTIMTPPDDEAIQYDIRVSKQMGFNGARKHQKVEDPRYLYWADKMGFLVSSEAANAKLFDPQYVSRFTREWIESVERDFNHPSIVMWVPINESWGTPDVTDPRQVAHLRAMYALTKSLDPSRLVIDNDGWQHSEMTDLFAVHSYARDGKALLDLYENFDPTQPVPFNNRPMVAPGVSYNGTPLYLSEYGGIAYIPPGAKVPEESWGYSGVEKTAESALDRLDSLNQAIRAMPFFVGFCYTQLTDVEQEVNGLLTFDRKPKFDVDKVRRIMEQ